jgi:hypothetical protein
MQEALTKREEVVSTKEEAMLSKVQEQKIVPLLPYFKRSSNGKKRKITLKLKLLVGSILNKTMKSPPP